ARGGGGGGGVAGAAPPQLGRGERRGGDARLRGRADRERGRKHRIGTGQLDPFERGRVTAVLAPQRGERPGGDRRSDAVLLRERRHGTPRAIESAPAIRMIVKTENAVAFTSSMSFLPNTWTANGKYPF